MIVEYYATIQDKDGGKLTYEVYDVESTRKILKSLEDYTITTNDIWAVVHDYDDSFYTKSSCALLVNEKHHSDDSMYKAGYVKVIGFSKFTQVWQETKIF